MNLLPTFVMGLISLALLLPNASTQQKPTSPIDPSRITGAPELCTGTGKKATGEQRWTLRIPVGDRLDEVFASSSNWITGITFRLADGKDRAWGSWDDHREHTHTLKDHEYIVGVRVHSDTQIDWMDLMTSQKRVLHLGHPNSGNLSRGTELLKVPPQSRVTGLSLYIQDSKPTKILRVEALYQSAR